MPLPKIVTPTYELTLPSTKQKLKYRPFLVKEEKVLVLAMETESIKEITNAVKQVIKNCIESPKNIKVETLPTFDIEYLFLNIRAKSVGEVVEVNIICPDDEQTQVPVEIPINDIRVLVDDEHDNKVKLDDNLMMEMRYPSLEQFIKTNFDMNQNNASVDQSFELIASCIDKIYNNEEVWDSADVSKKELVDFLDQMNSMQFKQIEKFFETMPKLAHTLKITNPNTGVESEVILEGLSSFFA